MTTAELLTDLRAAGLALRCVERPSGLEIRVRGQPTQEQADRIRTGRDGLLTILLEEMRETMAMVEGHPGNWNPWKGQR